MNNFGLDKVQEKENNSVSMENTKKKRKPFAVWTVGEKDYKLKLKSSKICQLEEKFKGNLLSILTGGEIPSLAIMLTIIQGAMQDWEHEIKFCDVQHIFDCYCDEGGTQLTLLTDVIMPIMAVSGFFTEKQMESMEEKVQETKDLM